jgi:hypothetical protein
MISRNLVYVYAHGDLLGDCAELTCQLDWLRRQGNSVLEVRRCAGVAQFLTHPVKTQN